MLGVSISKVEEFGFSFYPISGGKSVEIPWAVCVCVGVVGVVWGSFSKGNLQNHFYPKKVRETSQGNKYFWEKKKKSTFQDSWKD